LEDLLYRPQHSLVVQSKRARLGVETTNGDGFGVGWYGDRKIPGVYRSTEPAWNDHNMRELAAQATSNRIFAHIRAATGTPVQQSNCHPFRHHTWLWMHNGKIEGFRSLKRELVLTITPDLYPEIEGSTDSELLFYLALTYGLTDDPPSAVARAVGLIEELARKHNIENVVQMTVATTDGQRTWAFRYSTERRSRSLFHSVDIGTIREQYPDNPVLDAVSDDARLIVSEPIADLHGAWQEVAESSCLVINGGSMESLTFAPLPP
jgi:glutamine amidotransferase